LKFDNDDKMITRLRRKQCSPSLVVEQHLKRTDELQVRGGRDVVVSLEFEVITLRQLLAARVKLFTHLNASIAHLLAQFHLIEEPRSDRLQRVLRPRLNIKSNQLEFI